jgi:hypothetical protein
MPLTNYTELQASAASWLNKSNATAVIPDFVALAEADFNRRLRLAQNEASTALTLTGDVAVLPLDFAAARVLSDTEGEIDYVEPKRYRTFGATNASRRVYTILDDQIRATTLYGPLTLDYYQTVPPLALNATNWLLTRHPNLYLFQTLYYGAIWLKDEQAASGYRTKAEEAFSLLDFDEGNRQGGVRMRAA